MPKNPKCPYCQTRLKSLYVNDEKRLKVKAPTNSLFCPRCEKLVLLEQVAVKKSIRAPDLEYAVSILVKIRNRKSWEETNRPEWRMAKTVLEYFKDHGVI